MSTRRRIFATRTRAQPAVRAVAARQPARPVPESEHTDLSRVVEFLQSAIGNHAVNYLIDGFSPAISAIGRGGSLGDALTGQIQALGSVGSAIDNGNTGTRSPTDGVFGTGFGDARIQTDRAVDESDEQLVDAAPGLAAETSDASLPPSAPGDNPSEAGTIQRMPAALRSDLALSSVDILDDNDLPRRAGQMLLELLRSDPDDRSGRVSAALAQLRPDERAKVLEEIRPQITPDQWARLSATAGENDEQDTGADTTPSPAAELRPGGAPRGMAGGPVAGPASGRGPLPSALPGLMRPGPGLALAPPTLNGSQAPASATARAAIASVTSGRSSANARSTTLPDNLGRATPSETIDADVENPDQVEAPTVAPPASATAPAPAGEATPPAPPPTSAVGAMPSAPTGADSSAGARAPTAPPASGPTEVSPSDAGAAPPGETGPAAPGAAPPAETRGPVAAGPAASNQGQAVPAAGAAPPGAAAPGNGLAAMSTGNLALVDEELAEHQRWAAASSQVGAAGSTQRAAFVAEQAGAGLLTGFAQGAAMGLGMGLAVQAAEFIPIPGVGSILAGAMAVYGLANRDWSATADTISRFGEGSDTYEVLANSIASVSEIIDLAVNIMQVIAGILGIISAVMWIVTVVTVGVAAPLAGTLSAIALAITEVSGILGLINSLILQPCVMLFRALHTFSSQADPRDVEAQGAEIAHAAASAGGALGGLAGGALASGARPPPEEEPLPHPEAANPTPEPIPAATGEGPTVQFEEPSVGTGPGRSGGSMPAEPPEPGAIAGTPENGQPSLADEPPLGPRSPGETNELTPIDEAPDTVREPPEEIFELPEGSAMQADTPEGTREMYENSLRDDPHREVALYRNAQTGEVIAVQGDANGVPIDHQVWKEAFSGDPGDWQLVAHSHPVNPETGVTPFPERLPSSTGGDFSVIEAESQAAGNQPRTSTIDVMTDNGPDQTHFTFDPNDPRPYKIDYPDPVTGERTQVEFASREAYEEWYSETFPGRQAQIERPPAGGPAAPGVNDEAGGPPPPRGGGPSGEAEPSRGSQPSPDEVADQVEREGVEARERDLQRARRKGVREANKRLAEGARRGWFEPQDIDAALEMPADTMAQIQDQGSLPGDWGQQHHTAPVEHEPEQAANPDLIRPTSNAAHNPRLHQGLEPLGENEWEGNPGMKVVSEDEPDPTANPDDAAERWLRQNDPNYQAPRSGNYLGLTGDTTIDEGSPTVSVGSRGPRSGGGTGSGGTAGVRGPARPAPVPPPEVLPPTPGTPSRSAGSSGRPAGSGGSGSDHPAGTSPTEAHVIGRVPGPPSPRGAAAGPGGGSPPAGLPSAPAGGGRTVSSGRGGGSRFSAPGNETAARRRGGAPRLAQPGHGQPHVERVNPNYPPPPGTPQQLQQIQDEIENILAARARAEQAEQRMAAQEQHHQANQGPISEAVQGTAGGLTAVQAHQQAVERRQQANQEQQQRQEQSQSLISGYPSRAAGISALRIPLAAFQGFTHIASELPGDAGAAMLRMSRDADRLDQAFRQMDLSMNQQADAAPARQQELANDQARLQTTGQQAASSEQDLQSANAGAKALQQENEAKLREAQQAKKEAGTQKTTLGAAADAKQKQAQTLAHQLQAWANAHKQAREKALEETRKRLEGQGYVVREVRES